MWHYHETSVYKRIQDIWVVVNLQMTNWRIYPLKPKNRHHLVIASWADTTCSYSRYQPGPKYLPDRNWHRCIFHGALWLVLWRGIRSSMRWAVVYRKMVSRIYSNINYIVSGLSCHQGWSCSIYRSTSLRTTLIVNWRHYTTSWTNSHQVWLTPYRGGRSFHSCSIRFWLHLQFLWVVHSPPTSFSALPGWRENTWISFPSESISNCKHAAARTTAALFFHIVSIY